MKPIKCVHMLIVSLVITNMLHRDHVIHRIMDYELEQNYNLLLYPFSYIPPAVPFNAHLSRQVGTVTRCNVRVAL